MHKFATWRKVSGVTLVTIIVVGCGGGDEGRNPASSTAAENPGTGAPATSTTDAAPPKPGIGLDKQLTLSESFAKVGEPVGFESEFAATTPDESSRFTKNSGGVAALEADLPTGLNDDGRPTSVDGTVAASSDGSGMAQVGVEVTRNGRAQESRLTIFVEADLGYAAFGDASESATRRTLADGLLRVGAIDEGAHAERIAAIEGGG